MPALTPAQALRACHCAEHIDRINAALAGVWDAYETTHGKSIDVTGMSASVREQVKAEFRDAGWDVAYTADGDVLRLRP